MKLAPRWSESPYAGEYAVLTEQMLRCTPKERVFDASPYSAETIERAKRQWLYRMESEYRSTSTFAALANQMLAVRADVDLIGTTFRMAQDELRHAEICAEVVRALGGTAESEIADPVAPVAAHAGCSPEERLLRNVIYGCCVTETVNCSRFVDSLETMTDPFMRDVVRQLLSDEAVHAQFGFHYLESWRPWLESHPEARASIASYLRFALAVLDEEYRLKTPEPDDQAIALGLPNGQRTYEIFHVTMEAAVIPGLERFGLAAGDAWKNRSPA